MRPRRPLPASLAAALLALLPAGPAAAVEGNRVVLRVNDEIATLYDYQQRYDQRLEQIRGSSTEPGAQAEMMGEAGQRVMQELLEELLVVSRASQLVLEPTAGEIEAAVARARESFGINSDEQLAAALAESGMSIVEFREQMRRNLIVRMIMGREVQPRVELDDEELRRIYQERKAEFAEPAQVELRGVVVLESQQLDTVGMARVATEMRERLLAGATLDEVVPEYAGRGQTTELIEIGWLPVGDLDPALVEAVAEVEPGGYTMPIAARGGMHLLQVLDRREARTLAFDEVAERIRTLESDRRMQDELQRYLQELLDRSFIDSNPPPEAAGFLTRIAVEEPDPLAGLGIGGFPLPSEPVPPAEGPVELLGPEEGQPVEQVPAPEEQPLEPPSEPPPSP